MELLDRLQIGDKLSFDVTKKHPTYNNMLPIWEKCRDAYEGSEAIKEGGQKYLPSLNKQAPEDYHKYLDRAQWYGATGRTIQAYLGMLFQKDPIFEYQTDGEMPIDDDSLIKTGKKFFSLVTFDGKSIEDFLRQVVEEVIVVNRVGILVDFPSQVDEDGNLIQLSQYEYEQRGLKPLLATYTTENIINWHWEIVDNILVPRFFVLEEEELEFEDMTSLVPKEVKNYRVLYLQGNGANAVYHQFVIKGKPGEDDPTRRDYYVQDVVIPLQNGKPLTFIPFYIMTDKGLDYRDNTAPMINALVNTNIGHFRNSADWENELHWVGIKTLYLPGWDEAAHGEVVLGGALAGPAGSIPKMIEPKSDSGIKDEMRNKEERMAVLGAERIAQKGRYIPSAETARINSESENSTLTNMSKSLSVSISKILTRQMEWAGAWKKQNVQVVMSLNTDFFNDNITGDEVLKWVTAVQQGGISFDAFFYNMQKKEAFPENWTKEQEANALQEGFPGGFGGDPENDINGLLSFSSAEGIDNRAISNINENGNTNNDIIPTD